MIDYRQLVALATVNAEGGFEKAAQKLFITQSAVSRRIRQLESLLGEPVLIRSQPPKMTAIGIRLLNHLQQVQQLEVSLGLSNNALNINMPITVSLAVNADSLATWLPKAITFCKPEVRASLLFDIKVVDQSVGLNKMKAGEVMVCICDSPDAVNGGKVSALGAMSYHAVASPEFIKFHNITTTSQLIDLPCLVFDKDDKLQHQFLSDICGQPPKKIHLCPSSEGFKQSVLCGLGYGLLPTLQLSDSIHNGELINLAPNYVLKTPLYWHYWQSESPQLKALREHAMAVASTCLDEI